MHFLHEPNANAGNFYLLLCGSLADELHFNTVGQASIANSIIAGFNTRCGGKHRPTRSTEILRDLVNIGPDLAYQAWINCYDEQVVSKELVLNDDLEVTVLTTSRSLPWT